MELQAQAPAAPATSNYFTSMMMRSKLGSKSEQRDKESMRFLSATKKMQHRKIGPAVIQPPQLNDFKLEAAHFQKESSHQQQTSKIFATFGPETYINEELHGLSKFSQNTGVSTLKAAPRMVN